MFATGTPTATITLDRERTLGFTLGAMGRVREKLGKGAFTTEGQEGADDFEALPVYVWACLSTEDRAELSLDDVKELLHPGNMAAASDAVADLFLRSNPEGAEGNAGKRGKAKAST